jgi:hypothetical protein
LRLDRKRCPRPVVVAGAVVPGIPLLLISLVTHES